MEKRLKVMVKSQEKLSQIFNSIVETAYRRLEEQRETTKEQKSTEQIQTSSPQNTVQKLCEDLEIEFQNHIDFLNEEMLDFFDAVWSASENYYGETQNSNRTQIGQCKIIAIKKINKMIKLLQEVYFSSQKKISESTDHLDTSKKIEQLEGEINTILSHISREYELLSGDFDDFCAYVLKTQ